MTDSETFLDLVEQEENTVLDSYEKLYKDLLNRLGVNGHHGAIAEIMALRTTANLYSEGAA